MARPARAVDNDLTADHNPFLDALIDNASHWQSTTRYLEPQHIGVYFSNSGSGGTWTPAEIASFQDALGRWASVANISFDMVDSWRDANLIERKNYDTSADADLGQHEYPNDSDVAHGWFNSASASYTAAGSLGRGGDAFYTFVHEIGHALGLTHTHDGRVFPGVDGRDATGAEVDIAYGDLGDHDLNQGVFSVMSYNATYNNFPDVGDDFAWGRPMGPMAFDIAAIQQLYGANMNTATGPDTYVLPDVNDAGTGWSCIWDVSGVDQIVYDGMGNATIDLRAATLRNEVGGGGWLSHVDGIAGGLTIANGVWIENATGGSGADRITGNEHANQLDGRDGGDTIHGRDGGDTIHGGIGVDYLYGDAGVDTLHGDADGDVLYGGTEGDWLYGDAGADVLFGEAGVDRLYGGTEGDWLLGGTDGDNLYGEAGADTLSGDAGVELL